MSNDSRSPQYGLQKCFPNPEPSQGVIYTRQGIVELAINLALNHSRTPLATSRVLDIGCGYGQFCGTLIDKLIQDRMVRDLSWGELVRHLAENFRGIEVQSRTAALARARIQEAIYRAYKRELEPSTVSRMIWREDFLYWDPDPPRFDIIVGNLPYVRYDLIEDLDHSPGIDVLRKKFSTFYGRADYSVPFMERTIQLLDDKGSAAIITSNRFTRSLYGTKLRALLASSNLQVHEIDLSDIRAFKSLVSAYASIFLLVPRSSGKSVYARLHQNTKRSRHALSKRFPLSVRNCKSYTLTTRTITEDPWSILPQVISEALSRLTSKLDTIRCLGFSVRKGPATGADKVFIKRRDSFPFTEETKSRFLLPLFHWGSSSNGSADSTLYLLSLYEARTRRLLELDELPEEIVQFLEFNKPALLHRHVIKNTEDEWWRTIDRFDPSLRGLPKVMIPDLRPAAFTRLDLGELFPAHNVVYVTGQIELDVMRGLHVLLSSPFAEEFRLLNAPDMGHKSPRASSTILSKLPAPSTEALRDIGRSRSGLDALYDALTLSSSERSLFQERAKARNDS